MKVFVEKMLSPLLFAVSVIVFVVVKVNTNKKKKTLKKIEKSVDK